MEEINLIVVVITAFGAVLVLLSLLAGLMYLLAYLFPDRSAAIEAPPVVIAGTPARETELPQRKMQPDERERAAVIAAVLLTLEAESSRGTPAGLPETPGRSWKLAGRLERVGDRSPARGWKRAP